MFISWSVLWKGWFAVFKVKVTVKALNFGEFLTANISDRSNLVWWCIIISQSIIQKYHFAMFKVKATIVSTTSSEILKLLQSKLVWWFIITRQGKTPWTDFLAFTQGLRQRIWLAGRGLDCCHSWLSWYLKQGSIPVPIKKMWKEHCFCNEYTCLLSFFVSGSSVLFLYPFVIVMMST